jgi:hypothetical protein
MKIDRAKACLSLHQALPRMSMRGQTKVFTALLGLEATEIEAVDAEGEDANHWQAHASEVFRRIYCAVYISDCEEGREDGVA